MYARLDICVSRTLRSVLVTMVAAALMGGCSTPSALIRADDQAFSQSQQRLQRTIILVDEAKPQPVERALFLQAESFYRYRFETPPHNTMSYLAEGAAVITDFPALQSLAGSFDLVDLRLRASDSAIQLWETLLSRYPQTTLRPLTLYRLGWAYRNASAAGFPRQSPDEAFDILIKEQ